MLTTIRDRLGAIAGVAFVACIFVGNAIQTSGSSQSTHPSGQQVIKDTLHQASSASAAVGFVLEFLGFLAFMGFLGYLVTLGGRRGAAAGTAVVAGVTMLAIKLGSVVPEAALFVERHTISEQLAQLFNDMSTAAFVLAWLPFAVFVWAAATTLRGARVVGRPTTYIGIFLGVAGVALGIVGMSNPINANPLGFVLANAWLLVVAVRLAVKPPVKVEPTMPAPARVTVAA